MKRMLSLLLATMLVGACGTAPQGESLGSQSEGEGSSTTKYVVGAAIVVVTLCTVVPGAKRACRKHFMSEDGVKKMLQKDIDKLQDLKAAKATEGADTAKIDEKIAKINEKIESAKSGRFFTVYSGTIGKLIAKIKQTFKKGAEKTKEAAEKQAS